ncbi:MAG: hypothetical protein KME15_00785 [Drouetiella hepatica Uher 2000/2452]|jgi:hypothetical protein|uniref:Serine/threonine protein kinase n=1 Tax=Drouetiella hepatica Uher 2000/2452 TaxID=904376 RepID=A0A951UKZ6_9CYAN|nr:hypothetical protein [Drouetiella hepatica Uher 2000/2452]
MTLKTGESLQNSKYVVQSVLDQSDFGITYSAKHTLLDQPVHLQTLNEVVQQRIDFAQLKQQFLTEVRSISQRSDALRVLDCFEENALPYVVLQATSRTPHLSDWLTLPPEPLTPSPSNSELPKALKPEASKPEVPESEVPKPETVTVPINTVVPIAPELMREAVLPQIDSAANNGTPDNGTPERSPQSIQPRRIPVPFLMTLVVGLGLGAGAGFALRFQPTGATGLTPSLFGQEQTFPAQGDWPITEMPDSLSEEPKIEEPLYRTNVPDYSSTTPEPLYSPRTDFNSPPSASYPLPEVTSDPALDNLPSPEPSDNFSSPVPQEQAIDSIPSSPLDEFNSIPNIQPSAAPANPAPAAPIAPRSAPEFFPRTAPERSPKAFKPPVISQ